MFNSRPNDDYEPAKVQARYRFSQIYEFVRSLEALKPLGVFASSLSNCMKCIHLIKGFVHSINKMSLILPCYV